MRIKNLRTKCLLGAMTAGLLALFYALALQPKVAQAAEAKNLKVLPKDLTKKEIKKIMKGIAKALDVECDFCHDLDDMAKDSEHKQVARTMMRMVNDINGKYLKEAETQVTCMTCHRGAKKPNE